MGKQGAARWKVVSRMGVLLGLAFVLGGFIAQDVAPPGFTKVVYVTMGLWIAGGVLVLAGIVLNFGDLVRFARGGRVGEGANFALTVLLAVALVALLCYISTRRFARLDWTGQQKYELHTKTENILRSLDRDVEVTVVYTPADPSVMGWLEPTSEMLEEFKALSSHTRVQELDWSVPESRSRLEALLQRLGEDSVPGGCVVFATADSHEIVPAAKLIEGSYGPGGPVGDFWGEDAFATALTKLTETEKVTIYALTGHGERVLEAEPPMPAAAREPEQIHSSPEYSLSRAVKQLRKDNYEVKPLNLAAEGAVPEDCGALLIAGPRTPLSESEMRALDDYFRNRKGAAVMMFDPEMVTGASTNLPELLQDYGVAVRTDTVGVAKLPSIFGTIREAYVPVTSEGIADHAITADLKNYSFALRSGCPLEVVNPQPGEMLSAKAVLTGVETSWGETDYRPGTRQAAEYDAGQDVPPPVIMAAVVEPEAPPAGPYGPPPPVDVPGPRIVVIGSSLAFVNASVADSPANLYFFLNAVNWMAGKLHRRGIPAKQIEFNQVDVSENQVRAARYVFVVILPACIIALGISVWVIRRR